MCLQQALMKRDVVKRTEMKLNEIVAGIQYNVPLCQAIGHWVDIHYESPRKVIYITADGDTNFSDYDYTIDLKVTDVTSSQWQYDSALTNQ